MARKLVSLLCALALLASMVTIAATVTATADGTAFGNFSDGHYETDITEAKNKRVSHDANLGDVVILFGPTRSIKATDTATYDLGTSFEASWFVMFGGHEMANESKTVVTIGDLAVVLDRSGTHATATGAADVWAEYKGAAFGGAAATVTFAGLSADEKANMVSFLSAETTADRWSGQGTQESDFSNKRMAHFTVTYANGTLTVVVSDRDHTNCATFSGTVTGDFSAAKVSIENTVVSNNYSTQILTGGFKGTYGTATASSQGTSSQTSGSGSASLSDVAYKPFGAGTYSFKRIAKDDTEATDEIRNACVFNNAALGNLLHLHALAAGGKYVSMTSTETVDLSKGFDLTFDFYYVQDTALKQKAALTLGALQIVIDRSGDHYMASGDTNQRCSADVYFTYGGTLLTNLPVQGAGRTVIAGLSADQKTAYDAMLETEETSGAKKATEATYRCYKIEVIYDGAGTLTVKCGDRDHALNNALWSIENTLTNPDFSAVAPKIELWGTTASDYSNVGSVGNLVGTYKSDAQTTSSQE
ncbi:MAG: hypothetical protein J6X61_00960, partial [Clostridia bacterium]|nr:hypothetical protein [Clostridia bacterium]